MPRKSKAKAGFPVKHTQLGKSGQPVGRATGGGSASAPGMPKAGPAPKPDMSWRSKVEPVKSDRGSFAFKGNKSGIKV